MEPKPAWKRERRTIWLISALGVLSGSFLLTSALFFRSAYLYLPIAVILAWLLVFVIRRRRSKLAAPVEPDLPEEEQRKLFDRCARRSVNWLLIAFWEVCGMALGLIGLAVNSKAGEVAESLSSHLFILELVAFFLVKNLLLLRWFNSRYAYENRESFRRESRFVLLFSLIYWLAVGGLYYAFERIFVLNISAFATGVFLAWIVVYNLTRINRLPIQKNAATAQ